MEADFEGWATKAGLKCSDGRTIMSGAFKHQDKAKVPLVWQHGHTDAENVLGHAILEDRKEGVYAYGFFNKTAKAKHAALSVEHGDVNAMSIWANQLLERGGMVIHGAIREVSLVLSGANPGAVIESVSIRHSDGDEEVLDDEVIIYSGEKLAHEEDDDEKKDDEKDDENEDEKDGDLEDALAHADGSTIQDIYDSMSEEQQAVLHYMVGEALSGSGGTAAQSNVDDENEENDNVNVFEKGKGGTKTDEPVLSHSDVQAIIATADKDKASLKAVITEYGAQHGIENIETLFPEATQLTAAPEFFARRMEWVNSVLNGTSKRPFSRIKTATADLTFEDARAKGYIKGTMKKEEFFATSRRTTVPTTIYKKQKLDRDDIIDITDFDVVTWMKGEMRVMLDEEIARAILVGDGREVDDDDKINEGNIRPVATDDDFYTIKLAVNVLNDDATPNYREIIRAVIRARSQYRGTGTPTMYTTEAVIAEFLLVEDSLGRRIYSSLDQVATEMRVSSIVPVEVMEDHPEILAIIVNLADYVVGADRGGQVAMFDDFDIDFNQYKYLIETRISGALIRPKSAMVISRIAEGATRVFPEKPAYVPETGVITIPTDATVDYFADGVAKADGATVTVPAGQIVTVTAEPTSGHYFGSSEESNWKFHRTPTA